MSGHQHIYAEILSLRFIFPLYASVSRLKSWQNKSHKIHLLFQALICIKMGKLPDPIPLPKLAKLVPEAPETVLKETPPEDELKHYAPFTVSFENGFLPLSPPPTTLPPAFRVLDSLLMRAPMKTADGKEGLLAKFTFGKAVEDELPDLTDEIHKVKDDLRVISALYRDYCFLASAYLLEPCHQKFYEKDQERRRLQQEEKTRTTDEKKAREEAENYGVKEKEVEKERAKKYVTGEYGLARSRLPAKLARPLAKVADM